MELPGVDDGGIVIRHWRAVRGAAGRPVFILRELRLILTNHRAILSCLQNGRVMPRRRPDLTRAPGFDRRLGRRNAFAIEERGDGGRPQTGL